MSNFSTNTYDSPGQTGLDHLNHIGNHADLGKLMEDLQAVGAEDYQVQVPSPVKLLRGADVEEISQNSRRYKCTSCSTYICCTHKISDIVAMVSFILHTDLKLSALILYSLV